MAYLAIVFEHNLHLDKTVPALLMGSLMWAALALGFHSGALGILNSHGDILSLAGITDHAQHELMGDAFSDTLLHHLGKIAEILIFLIGAMTIVELIDLHRGFDVIKEYVHSKNKMKLLIILTIITFFLSSIIDNLTTTIVMISILRKLIHDKETRLWFASMIIIASNSGGAWSPIGDVTTTMLWIGKKVSAVQLIYYIFLPAVVSTLVPIALASFKKVFKGDLSINLEATKDDTKLLSSKLMLYCGLLGIIFVPIFKSLTHLPPYLGMMLSLAILWLISEYIHPEENFTHEKKQLYSPIKALSRIEMSSILFFLGILLAVAALETVVVDGTGALAFAAKYLDTIIPSQNIVIVLLGVFSAIIDNVPLVAAAMGMYDHPLDDPLWHFIAYAAGTGGSMLIIGSAAGVAAMGMEKINFIWYLKNITLICALGYFAGCAVFMLMHT